MKRRCEATGPFEAWTMLLEAQGHLAEVLERELEEVGGLPLSWYDVLAQLALAPENKLKMNELAGSVLLSKSGVTRLVDRMERDGLVGRAACPTDRRVVYAVLTDKGRKLFEKATPIHQRGVAEHFTNLLTEGEIDAIKSAFGKVIEAIEAPADHQARAAS